MVIDYHDALRAAQIVIENKEGRNTVKSSVKCGVVVGLFTGAGAILGPVGMLAGSACGSVVAYVSNRDKFKSIFDVIKDDMTDEERYDLIQTIRDFIGKLQVSDAVMLLQLAQGDISFQNEMFHILKQLIEEFNRSRSRNHR